MHEKKRRVRCELTAIFNGRFERALMSAEPLRPHGRKNLLASDPHYRPNKKSGNNAQHNACHRFLLFLSLKCLHQEHASDVSLDLNRRYLSVWPVLRSGGSSSSSSGCFFAPTAIRPYATSESVSGSA